MKLYSIHFKMRKMASIYERAIGNSPTPQNPPFSLSLSLSVYSSLMSIAADNSSTAAFGRTSPPSLTMELSPKNQGISPISQCDCTDYTVAAYWTMIMCVLVVVAYVLGYWSKRQIMSLRRPRPPPPSSDAAPPAPAPPAPRRERGLVCRCTCVWGLVWQWLNYNKQKRERFWWSYSMQMFLLWVLLMYSWMNESFPFYYCVKVILLFTV